jgi:hypothetical protein
MFGSLSIPSILVGVLAVWRITHLFWGEDGPGDIFVRIRRIAGHGFWGRLLDCFYCLSLWVAAPLAWLLGGNWKERAVLWFGLSGGAILLERATTPAALMPPPAHWEEKPLPPEERPDRWPETKIEARKEEIGHVMLR